MSSKSHKVSRIVCLHTADSNVTVFDSALRTAGIVDVTLHHAVRADLLAAAEKEGRLTAEISARTVEVLKDLCSEADAVVLTCSTLGPAADIAAANASIPIMRIDEALAAEAVEDGGKVVVLCAVDTTVEPTKRLFEKAAQSTGAEVTVQVVPGAWAAFKSGHQDRYIDMIATAAREARRQGATHVALAQASMAGASALFTVAERPSTSPVAGLIAAARAASQERNA